MSPLPHPLDDEPDPNIRLVGTMWDTGNFDRPMTFPSVEFFYLNPRRPNTPTAVWIDRMAFSLARDAFHGPVSTEYRTQEPVVQIFQSLELWQTYAPNFTRSDLVKLEAVARTAQARLAKEEPEIFK